jgi:hypothetical protein
MIVFAVANQQRAGRRRVVQDLAIEIEVVMGNGGSFGRDRRRGFGLVRVLPGVGLLGAWGALLFLGAERRHCTDKRHCAQREGTGDAVELSQLDLRISDSRVWISVRG